MTWTEVLQARIDATPDAEQRLSALLDLAAWLADADPRAARACV